MRPASTPAVELQGLYEAIEKRAGKEEASIFEAHQEMLSDPTLEAKIREYVEIGQTVEQALVKQRMNLPACCQAWTMNSLRHAHWM